jgi:uncharacterized phiE125 gp8 family phage protein
VTDLYDVRADVGRSGRTIYFWAEAEGKLLNVLTGLYETPDLPNWATKYAKEATEIAAGEYGAKMFAGTPAADANVFCREVMDNNGDPGVVGDADPDDPPAAGPQLKHWNGSIVTDDPGDGIDEDVALISLSEAKEYLVDDAESTESDAIIARLVNSVSAWVQNRCGSPLLRKTWTEFYNGDGSDVLMLRRTPVAEISSLRVDAARVFGSDSELEETTEYVVDRGAGTITLLAGVFSCGKANVKVVYDAGYLLADVPHDLRLAVKRILDHQWRTGYTHRKLDVVSDVVGSENRTYRDDSIPKGVDQALDAYRRYYESPQFSHADD